MRRSFREMNPVPLGAIGLVVAATVLVLSLSIDRLPAIGGTGYSAAFSEAAGLREGDEVRIAGVKVGEVSGVDLEGTHVRVDFRVDRGTEFGTRTRAAIKIRTLLGHKYLALMPEGPGSWPSDRQIPLAQTHSPFDVLPALEQLSTTIDEIDTRQLAGAFDTLSQTFKNSPEEVRASLRGLRRLSQTVASRDQQLRELLSHAEGVTKVLADRNQEFTKLLADGDLLLKEVRARRAVIHQVLINTIALAQQLRALVRENQADLEPALQRLNDVVDILVRNQRNLDRSLELLAPFIRMFTDTIGSGRWFDTYLQNLAPVPASVQLPGATESQPGAGQRGGNSGNAGGPGEPGASAGPSSSPPGSPSPSQSPDDDGGGLGGLLGVGD
ncbi:MAG: MCE family protein [Streptosporangiales bacterium]|nr:MCE family protein [Streptosporangiales bacterium]